MKGTLLAALARTSIGAIAIATAMPALAHAADDQAAAPAAAAPASPAQSDAASSAEEAKDAKDIVVTGTQIRGTTPAGQTIITASAAQAEEQGATNGNELLSQIPQAANMFQSLPSLAGLQGNTTAGLVAVARIPSQAVSLRNLPNVNTGGAPTLTLIDGHRVVPTGTNALGGQQVDNSTISTATTLRTEILPDGASAVYGSDAVTGVINYVTRDEYDGLQVQARAGVARKYWQYDGSIIAGTKWSTGGVYVSASYAFHDPLLGKDRDYLVTVDANPSSPLYNQPLGLNCFAPNISITTTVAGISSRRLYPLLGGPNGAIQPYTTNSGTNGNGTTANGIAGGNRCNGGDYTSFYPKEKRYNANFGLKQEITDGLTFGFKAVWGRRESETSQGITLSPTVTSTNINYRPVCNAPPSTTAPICGTTAGFLLGDNTQSQTVLTNLSAVLGNTVNSFVKLQSWQVTPNLTWDFATDWQARALFSYGESKTTGIQGAVDTTSLNARVTSGLINPYNLPGSAAGAFDRAFTYSAQQGVFKLYNAKVVADGPLPLLRLPGGQIRAALGAEYVKTILDQQATGTVLSPTPSNFTYINPVDGSTRPLHVTQSVKAAFIELQLPIVSPENDVPLVNAFNLSASARYDHYSDFGGTFNKMAGLTWKPVSWVSIRGNYNTSFAAPTDMNLLGVVTGAQVNNGNGCNGPQGSLCGGTGNSVMPYFQGFYAPGDINGGKPLPAGSTSSAVSARAKTQPTGLPLSLTNGTVPGTGPQTSKNFSIGLDISPPIIKGLSFGASYYQLKISNVIASPFVPAIQSEFDFHPELIQCHGGVQGNAANAPAACAVPLSLAELQPYLTPVTAGGPALPSSLTTTGAGSGSGTNLLWSTVLANYCEPTVYTAGAGGGANCAANSYSVFYVADNRSRNLGNVYSRGVDFHAAYRTGVPWGTVDANVSGTVNLATETQIAAGAAKSDLQANGFSKWRMTSNLGTNWGGLRAQVTWQHSAGYLLAATAVGTVGTATVPGTGAYGQTRVKGYDTFDLFFRYKFDQSGAANGLMKGLAMTLNVNNFLDIEPPRQGGSFANGTTLGRMFQLGLTKEF